MTDYTPPERIYVQTTSPEPGDDDFGEAPTGIWSTDNLNEDCTKYIRADLVEAAKQEEFARIRAEAEAFAESYYLVRPTYEPVLAAFFAALENGETFFSPKNDE